MDDTTKILSVSYGNFSCHLEGFDDSVETMKLVVSYFHELAGHDRFMDMEPQAPDMETLAQLTEEQVGAPVEVEAEGNSVSMRMAADDVEDTIADVEEAIDDAGNGDTIVLNTGDGADAAPLDDEATADDDGVDDESVAAKLQRIRAVVSHTDDAAETAADDAADTFTEDLAEAEPAPVAGNPLAQRLAELAKRNAERAAEEAGIALDLDADDDDDAELSAEELAELDAEFDAEEALDEVGEDFDADEDVSAASDDADVEVEAFEDDDISESELEDVAVEDTPEVEEADGSAEETGPLVLTDATPVATDDDDNYDLQEDIADAQREIAEQENARDKQSDLRDNVDANMTRILSQTDEHLAEPEGRRHRDAFAQLKAAVAATEAARQLGDAGATQRDKNEVFRDDLGALDAAEEQEKAAAEEKTVDTTADEDEAVEAEATEPETASTDGPLTLDTPIEEPKAEETPADDDVEVAQDAASEETEDQAAPAPAPLKLVSSQPEKTEEAPLDAASARLRQIAAQKEAAPAAKDGFAEFAKSHGATDLADLLEAAAAYIGLVEGEDDFSRPQVMKKVQSASDTEFSREDGLRAFGRLLRMNRLVKLSNGRFQVAEDTQYQPGDKAAQG